MTTTSRRAALAALLYAITGAAAMGCGPSAERPLLTATGLKFHKPGVSGLPVDVTFRVQNPNPKPLDIQRFSYDVFVNDHSIGRGFVPEALLLDAFKERQMTSRFNINYFAIPGAVKQILDQDRINATVRGTFYLKGRFSTRQLPFESTGVIPLGRDEEPKKAPALTTPASRAAKSAPKRLPR
jgi:LEA14-like dessication related protein